MSPFKGTLLAACLLASLLAVGPMRSAHAQRATETAAVDQSTQSLPPVQRSLQTAARPANPGNPAGLSGPEQRVALVIGNSNYQKIGLL